jgi:translation elongation factor EF-Tu-like GTPase
VAPADTPFAMTVEDVFDVEGRGIVLTGTIESGTVHVGDSLRLERDGGSCDVTVAGLERFTKPYESATAGEAIGVIAKGVGKADVRAGDRLVAIRH